MQSLYNTLKLLQIIGSPNTYRTLIYTPKYMEKIIAIITVIQQLIKHWVMSTCEALQCPRVWAEPSLIASFNLRLTHELKSN